MQHRRVTIYIASVGENEDVLVTVDRGFGLIKSQIFPDLGELFP